MTSTPLPPVRAVWLLTRLRLRRQMNLFGSMFSRKRKDPQGKRIGTAPKAGAGWLIGVGLTVLVMFWAFIMARQAALNLTCLLACGAETTANMKGVEAFLVSMLTRHPIEQVQLGFAWILLLLTLMCIVVPLASSELTQDSDLEWLSVLPLKRRLLIVARIMERSVVNSVAVWTLWPVLTVVAWYGQWGLLAPLVAIPPTLLLLLLTGVGRTLGDTGLRRLLPQSGLRNVQAVLSLLGLPFMLMAMAYGTANTNATATRVVLDLVKHLPHWLLATPPGLAVQAVYQRQPGAAWTAFGLCLLTVVGLAVATVLVLERQMAHGITDSGPRETGRGAPRPKAMGWQLGNAVQWRELRLLGRDRNFLVQTLVLPLVMVGMQFVMNSKADGLPTLFQNPGPVGAIAFGLAAYVLMQSAFQTLNAEGGALWLLYTVPRPLEQVLRDKALLWAVLGLVYPVVILGASAWLAGGISGELAAVSVLVLVGVPIYAAIAVAMGVFGCDPLAEDKRKRIKGSYTNLYLILVSFYTYVMFAQGWYQKLLIMVLSAGLALAMWQKARDQLPYLLDPVASPPARVSLADGLIAAIMFTVLQGLGMLIGPGDARSPSPSKLTIVFGIAGLLTYIAMRTVFAFAKTQGVPRILPSQPLRALGLGLVAGAVPAVAAWLYIEHLTSLGEQFPPLSDSFRLALPFMAVLIAPLAEEFIFRGLVYGGLRRSVPDWVAIALSSALFAAIHPSVSVVPVFFLGASCALAYRATGSLMAPMIAHALYNAAVVAMQW